MPRILGSTAHISPLILDSLQMRYSMPSMADIFPPLPQPFRATPERVECLVKSADVTLVEKVEANRKSCQESAAKPFCNDERSRPKAAIEIVPDRRDSPVSA